MKKDLYVVILAAGKGQRMESLSESYSKVAYPILGKPLVNYVLDAAKPLKAKETIVVVGFGGEMTSKCVKDHAKIVWQKIVNGTGDALLKGTAPIKKKNGDVLVLCGDTPLLTTETINKIYNKHIKGENKLTICSTVLANPEGYGRVIRNEKSHCLQEIRPYAELSEEEKEIAEVNSGIYIIDNKLLQEYLPKLSKDNKKNEYYLSDIVKMFYDDGHQVDTFVLPDAEDLYNINDRIQLAYAAKVIRKRVNHRLMLSGVSIEDPDTTYISPDVQIDKDTVILPNTSILGECIIGPANIIGPSTYLEHVYIGENSHISFASITDYKIGDNEEVGPFVKLKGGRYRVDN